MKLIREEVYSKSRLLSLEEGDIVEVGFPFMVETSESFRNRSSAFFRKRMKVESTVLAYVNYPFVGGTRKGKERVVVNVTLIQRPVLPNVSWDYKNKKKYKKFKQYIPQSRIIRILGKDNKDEA